MDNLFEKRNQFRLYDVNGIVLASAGDYIEIREPTGFSTIPVTLERDLDTHGVFFEFGDENQPLGFDRPSLIAGEADNPYDLIQSIYDSEGVDGRLQFEFLNWNGSIYVSQYLADLDLESIDIIDREITVNTRRVLLSDKFRTRLETPVNFSATTSIDGTAIGGISSESTFLHSKNILIEQEATSSSSDSGTVDGFSDFTTDSDEHIVVLDYNTNADSINFSNPLFSEFGNSAFTNLYETIDVSTVSPAFIFKNVRGLLTIDYEANYTLAFTNFGGSVIEHVGTYVKVNTSITEIDSGTSYPASGSSSTVCNVDFNYSGSFFIPEDASVIIYDVWDIPTNTGVSQEWRIIPDQSDQLMEMSFESYIDNSFADTYDPFDSINHVLEVINDTNNVLESTFLSSTAEGMRLTNGYKIRDFSTRNVITSFKTLFNNWLQPTFGLGYAIYDDSGTFKVLMERYEEFYQNDEIYYIEDIEDGSFQITTDKTFRFNEINIGYKDYPKSTDENKSNNLDEFNTEHDLVTPIQTIKKKKDYISDVIASGYLIENSRREQFKEVPEDSVTNDSKVFCINSIDDDAYEDLTMSFLQAVGPIYFIDINATYLNLSIGDVITISNSASNNKAFTIEEISFNLNGNVNFLLGVRLTVTESNTIDNIDTGVTLTKSSSFLRALRNEEFVTLNNVISPETVYNVGLNPKYMLFNQSPLINSGFNPKSGADLVKTQDVKLNEDMQCRFASGEGGYILDPDRETVTMDGNLTLNQLNNYGRLFTGNLIKFTTSIGYDNVLLIRDAYLNQASTDNFGYLRVNDGSSDFTGFLTSMTYNPLNEKVDFILMERYV